MLAALAVCALTAPALAAAADGTPDAARASTAAPVPSLDPAATARLWQRLVRRPAALRARSAAGCRPLRGIFYAPTDWLRLATKLAENASPCAQYYVSVPPIVGDKTKLRPDAAWRIRALGPNFHAMAEIHYATWTKWVASTGSTWFQAGTTARERMAAAGYDVTKGDTWVVNEASTAVRKNTGNARANLRELLRGLYEGDGTRPTQGALFVVGVGQQSTDLSLYQSNLQSWLSDADFWTDMGKYVSDWSQETYGDIRNVQVPGEALSTRRDYLNDYLEHELVLANAGPDTIETARSYLRAAYSPLANAAWERSSGYGWTMVPAGQMASYVASQVYALRYFSATSGEPQDHWGFAWAPRNASGYAAADFATQTNGILDRLGAAIRDSASTDTADPGSGACGPTGHNLYCVGDLAGAHFNDAWKSFRVWTQPVLAFTTPPQTIPAGSPSGPIGLALLNTRGQPFLPRAPVTVTVSSSSPQGTFSTSSSGPWSPTLSLTIPAGTSTAPPFYYLDPGAGSPTLIASAPETTSGTQMETVTPGAAVALVIAPATASVPAGGTRQFTASGRDSFGNLFPVPATWTFGPGRIGTISPTTGSTTTFTALRSLGTGTITATLATPTGTLTSGGSVTVVAGRLEVRILRFQRIDRHVFVSVDTVDEAAQSVANARISLLVLRNGRRYYARRVTTGAAGRVSFVLPARRGGCFTAVVTRVSAAGFTWDGRTPRPRLCVRPRRKG